ncbi:MAG: adenylate/guanylate cyclase domain-containing protein [Spirochaetes bacterium]|nr:adenylate/guanylate cyclase domain-containing protein [Spirochaetota bacterium]
MNAYTKNKIVNIAIVILVSSLGGAVFASFLTSSRSESQTVIHVFILIISGALIGLIIGGSIATLEAFKLLTFKKLPIAINLLLKSVVYALIIATAYLIVLSITIHSNDIFNIKYFLMTIAFSSVATLVISTLDVINQLLGQQAMQRLFFGKYLRPVKEERVFMFLDLKGSTTIAEKIGDIKFHSFLDDFFSDIVSAILECRGEIYKYIGDEIIITWTIKNGLKKQNALKCFFLIKDKIDYLEKKYTAKYSIIPQFKAGVHCGTVVVGQMGDIKREVAFLGDVMNTTARVIGECNRLNNLYLISKDFKKLIEKDDIVKRCYDINSEANIALRGKKHETELFSVTRR